MKNDKQLEPPEQVKILFRAVSILRSDMQEIARDRSYPAAVRQFAKEALSDFDAAVRIPDHRGAAVETSR